MYLKWYEVNKSYYFYRKQNSTIKPMKNYLLLSAALLSLASCVRKPEACLQSSTTSAKLGQPVTFTNCSDKAETYDLDYGDGSPLVTEFSQDLSHGFQKAGNITVKLTAWSKKNKKSDEATVAMNIAKPEKSEVTGTWNYYKSETSFDTWFFGSGTESQLHNNTYDFRSTDSLYKDNYYYDKYIFSSDEALISYGSYTYSIVKLYNNEMVLREGSSSFGYTYHYFKR